MTHSPCTDAKFSNFVPNRLWILRLLDRYLAAQALHKQHQALLYLDDALLRDIGITRHQAIEAAAGPVWNAPNHWKI